MDKIKVRQTQTYLSLNNFLQIWKITKKYMSMLFITCPSFVGTKVIKIINTCITNNNQNLQVFSFVED